jgi:group II intron reverse transcriptase/maturase
MTGTQKPENVLTKQQRIAELSEQFAQRSFTSLSHYIDREWLREAYRRTRKDGAVGVDGQTAVDYEADLEANLQSLLDRAKSGRYRAPPVRRVQIPKGSGSGTRPIGIPTLEDKILQRAVAMTLEPLYEQDFLDCSYGFRPGRSAHQALDACWRQLMGQGGGWVIELDIKAFFDTLDRRQLRSWLKQRVSDGVLCRLIDKWLKAGVLEDGVMSYPGAGVPQGSVIGPILSNLYLHEVLDVWFEHEVKPRLKGRTFEIRYADDALFGFSDEADAQRVLAVLPKRFEKYGLTLHPTKTRLVDFRPPLRRSTKSGSFDLLGFTHYWGKSRKGHWVIQRKTAKDRFRRAVKELSGWCWRMRHQPIREQHTALVRKVRGHYAYYGIMGNYQALGRFRFCVEQLWIKWLGRRSQRSMNWEKARRILDGYPMPSPRIIHSIKIIERS